MRLGYKRVGLQAEQLHVELNSKCNQLDLNATLGGISLLLLDTVKSGLFLHVTIPDITSSVTYSLHHLLY